MSSLTGRILYEDNHILVVNKMAGELVQGDQTGDAPLSEIVKSYIKEKYKKPGAVFLGVVHRLDRPTSGVVLFAKTSKALSRLNSQFKERIPEKTYWAVVTKEFPEIHGHLTHWLTRNTKLNKSSAFDKPIAEAKEARLHFTTHSVLDRYKVLEINLETGRHHQIRAQLSHLGFPIQGDFKYGAPRSNSDGSISLHARQLKIIHPVTKENLTFTASPPDYGIWKAVPCD